jgi:hypothetical protein
VLIEQREVGYAVTDLGPKLLNIRDRWWRRLLHRSNGQRRRDERYDSHEDGSTAYSQRLHGRAPLESPQYPALTLTNLQRSRIRLSNADVGSAIRRIGGGSSNCPIDTSVETSLHEIIVIVPSASLPSTPPVEPGRGET